MLYGFLNKIKSIPDIVSYGKVVEVKGLLARVIGLPSSCSIGSQGFIITTSGKEIPIEVVGFKNKEAMLMAYETFNQVSIGSRVEIIRDGFEISPCENWKGRVINGFGNAVDNKGILPLGDESYKVYGSSIPSFERSRVHKRLNLGIKAINAFATCCEGQRLGIFSGSGVGKSMLMSQMAKFSSSDINVIGLIGERGREVLEFIEDKLGDEGMSRSIVIVANSDDTALMRRQAAYLTLTVAEYFRNKGKKVLCMMDSVTRFAMAIREIGLSIGEPPTTKGYTPSVFAELPRLLERAGPGKRGSGGSITGLFTVLVDGDDHNEPIADAVRGILDGHIVLDRKIAERNRFPAIDVLKSISRMMPDCNDAKENEVIVKARKMLSLYSDMEDMIRIGAYRKGSDEKIDESIVKYNLIESFLSQGHKDNFNFEETFQELNSIFFNNEGIDRIDEE